MTQTSDNNKRIAKNTLFLYFRSLIIMAISIFTSRIVLQTLGISDYGIYNVVGGFVGMFSILSSSLVNASQRFISYEMGKQVPQLSRVFCGTVSVHLILVVALLILFESVGLWFLNTHLNISPDRIVAANWVYQCSVLTFCVNLISVPYNATIIAHEKMSAFAYIGIYEVLAKLGIVYFLWLTDKDKLIIYAILLVIVSLSLRFIYGYYCKKQFEECNFKFKFDKIFIKSLLGFTGWNFIGSVAGILVTQGVNVLINLFFGVALNAARGIAEQVNNAINQFITNFMTAMNPQITKSCAAKDYEYMNKLMIRGAKYSTLLFVFLSLPIFMETDFVLGLWLVEVPPYAPLFLRLAIIYSTFQSLSNTLYIGMLATGRIKKYQIMMGSIYIMSFILCFIFFKIGLGPEWGYISTILALFVGMFVRLYLLRSMISGFSIFSFIKGAIFKVIIVIFFTLLIICTLNHLLTCNEILKSIIIMALALLLVPVFTYTFSLSESEKAMLKKQCVSIKAKVFS